MNDTIAAIATPSGRGGVGIVRISGPLCRSIAQAIMAHVPEPRSAQFCTFKRADGSKIDVGLALFFPGPNSFTGEDVLELQGHGSPIILDMLLSRVIELGARLARPGEFSERAFINDKLDLIQAEAIAQLISAGTEQAAIAAMRSLQGEFSQTINLMIDDLIRLRMYVEAAIDFPDEDISFLEDANILQSLRAIRDQLDEIKKIATQGSLLAEGINVVIAGQPNVGKSTLLNRLTGEDSAIVTPIAGTTRDTIKAQVNFDGLQVNITDTAGLRETDDIVEKAGIERSWQAINLADLVLVVMDCAEGPVTNLVKTYPQLQDKKAIVIYNKIDKLQVPAGRSRREDLTEVYISANTGAGLDALRAAVKDIVDCQPEVGVFTARRRHLTALAMASAHIHRGGQHLTNNAAGELLAEELKIAQQHLEEITGRFTSDDLLGKIFSEFCIGK